MALKNIVGVDHAVVVVKELDRAAETWKRLGFTVSPRGTHSAKMGSGNYTIMLGSDYIELLGVLAETEHNAPTRAFLARRGDGIERIAFTAVDSAAGAAEIRARGYAAARPDRFRTAGDDAGRHASRRRNSAHFNGRSRRRRPGFGFSPASTRRGRRSGFRNCSGTPTPRMLSNACWWFRPSRPGTPHIWRA